MQQPPEQLRPGRDKLPEGKVFDNLNPDLYDEDGFPVPITRPDGAIVGGDLAGLAAMGLFGGDPSGPPAGAMQIIGSPRPGAVPVEREATLEDCVDDCPMCQHMRKEILAGRPPRVMAFQ
jgi:hypothetical protein